MGLNGTVFAYGATGSGKTHTMARAPAPSEAPQHALNPPSSATHAPIRPIISANPPFKLIFPPSQVGNATDPGLMVLSLEDVFRNVAADRSNAYDYEVQCSYIEVYNEVIYDLLEKSSTPLDLREDVNGVAVVQARKIKVESAEAIMGAPRTPLPHSLRRSLGNQLTRGRALSFAGALCGW